MARRNATAKIQSFIFLDLETTGFEANNEIAEIAMVAVHRDAMKKSVIRAGRLPRVLDKLVLCVDPEEEVRIK